MDYKTQEEYFLLLAEELKYLHPRDATKVLQFYQHKISVRMDYGEKESDILASLPTPEEVAKEAYESHGVAYLEKRKKINNRKAFFSKIGDVIILFFVIVAFVACSIVIGSTIGKMFILLVLIAKAITVIDIICIIGILAYIFAIIVLYLYFIDLMYILFLHFFNNIYKYKNESIKHKLSLFTISGSVDRLFKQNKMLLKIVITLFIVLIAAFTINYTNKGYVYRSINNLAANSKEIEIDNDFDKLSINATNALITINETDRSSYIEYIYEFNHELQLEKQNNILQIGLEKTKAYDVLDLLKEPVQQINIYINSACEASIDVKIYEGTLEVKNINVKNINIDCESSIKTTIYQTTSENIKVSGYEVYLGVNNSTINSLVTSSTKGQFIVEESSSINSLDCNNSQGKILFKDSIISDLKINNTGGSVNFNNIKGDKFTFVANTSKNTFKDIYYKTIDVTIDRTGNITFTNVIAEETIKAAVTDSYFIMDYAKSPLIKVNAKNGAVLLSSIGTMAEDSKLDANINSSVEIENSGTSCKTQVGYSELNDLNIKSNSGFIMVIETVMKTSSIAASRCKNIQLSNIDGENMIMTLNNVDVTTVSSKENKIYILVKQCDAISYAGLQIDKNINWKLEQEGGQNEN